MNFGQQSLENVQPIVSERAAAFARVKEAEAALLEAETALKAKAEALRRSQQHLVQSSNSRQLHSSVQIFRPVSQQLHSSVLKKPLCKWDPFCWNSNSMHRETYVHTTEPRNDAEGKLEDIRLNVKVARQVEESAKQALAEESAKQALAEESFNLETETIKLRKELEDTQERIAIIKQAKEERMQLQASRSASGHASGHASGLGTMASLRPTVFAPRPVIVSSIEDPQLRAFLEKQRSKSEQEKYLKYKTKYNNLKNKLT